VFIPSCFTHPDILRTIEVASLLDLLRPHEKYFRESRVCLSGLRAGEARLLKTRAYPR
jgi:hypothetical protein